MLLRLLEPNIEVTSSTLDECTTTVTLCYVVAKKIGIVISPEKRFYSHNILKKVKIQLFNEHFLFPLVTLVNSFVKWVR